LDSDNRIAHCVLLMSMGRFFRFLPLGDGECSPPEIVVH
jgi:hypothetical protein